MPINKVGTALTSINVTARIRKGSHRGWSALGQPLSRAIRDNLFMPMRGFYTNILHPTVAVNIKARIAFVFLSLFTM